MTTSQLPLRDYQAAALDAVRAAWDRGVQRPAVVAPTGAGKTVMFAHLIAEHLGDTGKICGCGGWDPDDHQDGCPNDTGPPSRAIVLVHRDELADQAIDKIRQVAPSLHVGKVKAEFNEINADVVVASVQTLARPARFAELLDATKRHGSFGLVVVDEAHHAVAPSWRAVLQALGCFQGVGPVVVGFSATLARGDDIGLGSVWQEIAYAISLTRLIRRGYLADVRGVRVRVDDLDLTDVRQTAGDFQVGALGDAMTDSAAAKVIATSYREHAAGRPGVVFAPTVAAAEEITEQLHVAGLPAATITGATPRDDRRHIYAEFQAGRTQVLVNCMVLTEGWDAPWASCAVIARPTRSAALYQQMVGRVLRPYPGKRDALVLDVVGASEEHKLATLIDLEPGTVRTMRADQTLLDAIEDQEDSDKLVLHRQTLGGALHAEQVELFAQSTSVWLQTDAGLWFIPAGDRTYCLWPSEEPGAWDVAWMPKDGQGGRPHRALSFELAMSWAQVEAEEHDPTVASRTAAWRGKGGGRASAAQLSFLNSLGVDGAGLSKNDASNAISVALTSRRLDRHFRKAMWK